MALKARPTVTVIINPHGGSGRARDLYDHHCAPVLRRAGVRALVHLTTHRGHATELVAELPSLGGGLLVVGGDGLVQEVVTGLQQRTDACPPLAVAPGGSANALAHALYGGACQARACVARRAAMALVHGTVRAVDLLRVDTGAAGAAPRFALSMVGAGLAASVADRADGLRWLPGHRHFRYELAGLLTVVGGWPKDTRCWLSYPVDGAAAAPWVEREMDILSLMAVNHANMGKTRHIARDVALDDGRCHLTIVPNMPKRQAVRVLGALSRGKVLQDQPGVISLRLPEFKLRMRAGHQLNIDGDVLPARDTVHVRVLPNAVPVFWPAAVEPECQSDCPLLACPRPIATLPTLGGKQHEQQTEEGEQRPTSKQPATLLHATTCRMMMSAPSSSSHHRASLVTPV